MLFRRSSGSKARHTVQWWPGAASIKDAVADVLGIASALSALVALEACYCLPAQQRSLHEPL